MHLNRKKSLPQKFPLIEKNGILQELNTIDILFLFYSEDPRVKFRTEFTFKSRI